ncbi:AAA family ATPase [Streptomyces sp. GESEQ-35]|uniref:ATP-binding protein n=1 Tax=Streptomyces sp. GESEQ-35 TaxID=2812657 RepID=UPI001B342F83|nr:LuxR family transcriptional regulator [Streptomyces sp. GESEQ-35]
MGLVGRTAEIEVVQKLLDEVQAGSSGVLVLRGQAGIGKTALLGETAERAVKAGTRLAQAMGTQAEMGFDFAGLHQMLVPFLEGLPDLPVPQRTALETVFGLAAGKASSPFLIGLATLTLLTDAAEKQPVLCVVDDAQWLDRVSQEVLAFVARRLLADRVGLVFSLRDGEERAAALNGFPELRVRALEPDAGRELLEQAAGGRVAEPLSRRVLAVAAGHPLTLIELGRELGEGRGIPDAVPGLPMRVGERLERLYLDRVRKLTPAAQTLLLVAAAEHLGDPEKVRRAAEVLGLDPEVAMLPEVGQMLSLSPRVAFNHPLMRTAAYWGASPGEQRRVHAALAQVTDPYRDPDRRAWHLAEATDGPDEVVARELESSAGRARRRGGWESEQTFLRRAADLTADPVRDAERRLAAAEAGLVAGDVAGAAALAGQAVPHLTHPLALARARRVQGLFLQAEGRVAEAAQLLVGAAQEMGPEDLRLARDTLFEGFSVAQLEGWQKAAEVVLAVRELPRPATGAAGDGLLDGFAAIRDGRTTEGYALLREGIRTLAAVRDSPDTSMPRLVAWLYASGLVFDHSTWTDLERYWIPAFRDRGAVAALVPALFSLGYDHLRAGRLTTAEAALAEGRAFAEAVGDQGWGPSFAQADVWLLGLRGELAEGRALADRLLSEPIPDVWRDTIRLAVAVLELGAGRYEEALDAALDARALWSLLSPEDVIEAAMRCGRPEIARAALDDFSPLAAAAGTPWVLGVTARCQALLRGDHPDADDDYQQSIDYLQRTPVALAVARSRLVYGEWLRRQRRRRDARHQLSTALESFERMPAYGFADRARAELAATGEHRHKQADPAGVRLTPQELQIAQLAAGGATNRDIATRLFLSAATVDYHLRSVYRKLGVSRRVLLAQALVGAGITG